MTRPEIIKEDVPIGPMTTLEVGGPARYFATCDSVLTLQRVLQWGRDNALPVFVLGAGSNVLVADAGFDGLVVRYTASQISFNSNNDAIDVVADAGADWDGLVERCVADKLAGIECLSGIPGLVGATPIQNIGAYGQEVATTIQSVVGVDPVSLEEKEIPVADCGFGYRISYFKTQKIPLIVTAVRYRLARKDFGQVRYEDLRRVLEISATSKALPSLAQTRAAVIQVRRNKSMVISADDPNRRSAGSFFLNPVLTATQFDRLVYQARLDGIAGDVPSFPAPGGRLKVPAAWLIEQAGFKRGFADGVVGLSSKHALAVINRGDATADDIIEFARRIRLAVQSRFAITLLPEPVFIGFDIDPGSLLSR